MKMDLPASVMVNVIYNAAQRLGASRLPWRKAEARIVKRFINSAEPEDRSHIKRTFRDAVSHYRNIGIYK